MTLLKNRIWIDGCFDFFHHGHANAILQAKQEGDELYIGIHSDQEIARNKGPTVMTQVERYETIIGNKWATKCITDVPYVTDPKVMDQYSCYYVIHGDDITTDSEGNDCYGIVRDAGRLKLVKRTDGISTTDLINRLMYGDALKEQGIKENLELVLKFATGEDGKTQYNSVSLWKDGALETLQDSGRTGGKVYVEGVFDLFNPFHVHALQEIKASHLGKEIIVLLLKSDDTVMNLLQRTLCTLQCKYVDGITIGVDNDFPYDDDATVLKVDEMTNDFAYLKTGIKQRIRDNFQLYRERQLRKEGKSAIEADMK